MRRFVVLSCRPFSTQNASLGDRPENGIFLQNQSFAQRKAMWQLRAQSPPFLSLKALPNSRQTASWRRVSGTFG